MHVVFLVSLWFSTHRLSSLSVISLCAVKEVDLALWRSAEAIANDKRQFMNDGEWELLSIPSHYWQIQQDDTDYAHIQFNVCLSLSQPHTLITQGII